MPEQLILGIDTATEVRVGLADGSQVLSSLSYEDPRRHVEQLTPLIEKLIKESGVTTAQLTKIIVGVGPGPYTGLRVGIATARTIGFVLGVQVRGVCTLDVLAAQWLRSDVPPADDFLIATDARRKEIYWARYAPDGSRVAGPSVGKADELPQLPVAGPATEIYPELQASANAPVSLDAGVLALVGSELADAGIEPLYLRSPDAAPPGPRKSVLPRVLS
ncbi:tRNA (adenosine(37)-N6)-threonylcarbamoyltransferase complex dimerization subunit type 1 TsaB [Microlunatus elymi]|uniref:tRNA (Adenosine(37)-N6)-threonylcarbamoyltransferase complex dimerization subunit type 1 TsaB n=1 Tax=Microlunatus elymi TaxID=2596828 RepID=A0A516PWN7_9ACTN|nr:tRNA (adenosine(37)-N6)-threonylcarbamoyltransferase complex dimerization subunit type 1 TsaB [Microlunatus elymi]QDP95598.1 tRNA (adenosine(37)-N6)-threonylcarbamoyltransferase complex dimerization subunit type 1 TsaB [Microlunatus elymi]